MRYEIKTYQFICDLCGDTEITQNDWFHRPKGWTTTKNNNPLAMFIDENDICPKCSEK